MRKKQLAQEVARLNDEVDHLRRALDRQRRTYPIGGDGSCLQDTLAPWFGRSDPPSPWKHRLDLNGFEGYDRWVQCTNGWTVDLPTRRRNARR